MRFTLACPKGLITDQEIEYIVTCGKDGQFAVLKNHVPVVVPIVYSIHTTSESSALLLIAA